MLNTIVTYETNVDEMTSIRYNKTAKNNLYFMKKRNSFHEDKYLFHDKKYFFS